MSSMGIVRHYLLRRIAVLFFMLLLTGCPDEPPPVGSSCSSFDACGDDMACVDFRCFFTCELEGDCDPEYACVEDICMQSCDSTEGCEFGTCQSRDDGREGKVCSVETRFVCSADPECGEGRVCEFGFCYRSCRMSEECEPGEECRFRAYVGGLICVDPGDPPPSPG